LADRHATRRRDVILAVTDGLADAGAGGALHGDEVDRALLDGPAVELDRPRHLRPVAGAAKHPGKRQARQDQPSHRRTSPPGPRAGPVLPPLLSLAWPRPGCRDRGRRIAEVEQPGRGWIDGLGPSPTPSMAPQRQAGATSPSWSG